MIMEQSVDGEVRAEFVECFLVKIERAKYCASCEWDLGVAGKLGRVEKEQTIDKVC